MPSPVLYAKSLVYELERGRRGLVVCRFRLPGATHTGASTLREKGRLQKLLRREWIEPEDRRILMQLYMAFSRVDEEVELLGKPGARILREMLATGRCVWQEGEPDAAALVWSEASVRGELGWEIVEGGLVLPVVRVGEGASEGSEQGRTDAGASAAYAGAAGSDAAWAIAGTAPPVAIDLAANQIRALEGPWPESVVQRWLTQEALDPEVAVAFVEGLQAACEGAGNEETEALPEPPIIGVRVRTDVAPQPWLMVRRRRLYPKAMGEAMDLYIGELWLDYDGHRFRWTSPVTEVRQLEGTEMVEIRRDAEAESALAETLEGHGLRRLRDALKGYELEDAREDFVGELTDPEAWYAFLTGSQAELEAAGWTFVFEGQRALAIGETAPQYCDLEPTDRPGWFEFEAGVVIDGQRVNLLPLIHDLLKRYQGQSPDQIREALAPQVFFVPTVTGQTHLFRGERFFEMVERIFELYDRDPFHASERVQLTAIRAAELADAFGHEERVPGISPAIRKVAGILREGVTIEPSQEPEGLRATLRDYQRIGVGWLQFLAAHEVNGVLADEMGLGKTLQTIAHLLTEKEAGRLQRPALLVAPTSLVPNWKAEVERFAPGLRVMVLQGSRRAIYFRAMEAADLVITTYGMVRSDAPRHYEQTYSWVILDEAQFIKNTKSKVTEVLCRLKSEHRLCLTGTPLENHLRELWSLFHFLMPGILGERDYFKRQFSTPIEVDGNSTKQEVLMRRVRPFLLRRKKSDVVKELPPKTEIQRRIEMTGRQRDIYESVRLAMHKKEQQEISERGLARSQIIILDAIMKLRQICCDPRLAKLEEEGLTNQHSAKLAQLVALLPDMIADGHRILVFSQFTSMLKLMSPALQRAGLDFVTLTGSTRNRAQCVEAFQAGRVPLFLISLRAGGTGLNLTEADTVIHYDPWWNPAVESQATDRAHRIGQQRPVFVYKLIAEDSVEEKIVAMQKQKAALAENILSGNSSAKLQFDEADVTELLG